MMTIFFLFIKLFYQFSKIFIDLFFFMFRKTFLIFYFIKLFLISFLIFLGSISLNLLRILLISFILSSSRLLLKSCVRFDFTRAIINYSFDILLWFLILLILATYSSSSHDWSYIFMI